MLGAAAGEGLAKTTAYLFGRKTYQKVAAHWLTEPDTNPIAAHLNATPKYVVTGTLNSLEWAGSHVLAGDVVASVNDLKQHGDGTIAVLGSGVLVQALIEHDIVYRCIAPQLPAGTAVTETRSARCAAGCLVATWQFC